jgi:hypothetical protein
LNKLIYKISTAILILFILIGTPSCEKFEGDQTVPAYIQVDTFYLEPNPVIEEGPLTHKITDVWVYANDQLIGAFELPALVPILEQGAGRLRLVAGIKYNGLSGIRGPYYFYQPQIIEDFTYIIDSVQVVNPTISYYSTSIFAWMEDFEDAAITLNPTSRSDTSLQLLYNNPSHPKYGGVSAVAYLDDQRTILEVTTNAGEPQGFELPSGGTPTFLEMDYNTTELLIVGLYITDLGAGIIQHPILVLNPTDGVWNKIYVNLTPTATSNPNAEYFNIFLRADRQTIGDLSIIKIDNLKLVHLPQF